MKKAGNDDALFERRGTETRDDAETLEIHLERYRFAADHARPGRLLDLACGVGYGTRLMADRQPGIESALGVDLSKIDMAVGSHAHGDHLNGFDYLLSVNPKVKRSVMYSPS